MGDSIIPKEWSEVKLGSIANITTGKKDVNEGDADGMYPFFTCSQEEYRINDYSFDTEAILVAGNAYFNVKYYKGKFDAYQRTYVIDGFKDSIAHYIYYVLFKDLKTLTINNQGSAVKYIKLKDLTDFKFFLPPAGERKKIIDILLTLDSVISKTQAIIDQTQTLKKGLMQELFIRGITGKHKKFKKTEIGLIPEEWVTRILGKHSKILSGGTPSTKKRDYWNGKIPWITSADIFGMHEIYPKRFITKEAIKESATNLIPKDNIIVVTRVGLGKVAINRFDLCISQDSQGVIPDKSVFFLEYLAYYLGVIAQKFIIRNQGTAIKGVLKEDLLSLVIPLPRMEEQKTIASILTKLDNKITSNAELIKQITSLKSALMQVLLTGEVRVKT